MENDHLDRFIKKSLEQFDAGSAGDSWSLLNQKLNNWDASDPQFDQSIKSKVENLEDTYEPAQWAMLAASLDFVPELDHINQDIVLDEKAAQLGDLELEYEPSSWDLFEEKISLDQDLSNIEILDEIDLAAYDKLNNLNIPFNENHWNIFQPELDKEFILPYKLLFKYKLIEVSVILLLLIGIYQHVPISSKVQDVYVSGQQSESELVVEGLGTEALSEAKRESKNTPNEQANLLAIASSPLVQNEVIEVSENPTESIDEGLNEVLQNDLAKNQQDESFVASYISKKNDLVLDASFIEESTESEVFSEVLDIENKSGAEQKRQMPKIKSALLGLLNFNNKKINPHCLVCENPVAVFTWRLSAQVNTDYNYIMTPYDKVLSVDSYAHAAIGYGAGLMSSVGFGKWDVEFGANYVARSYTPKPIQERVGNLSDGYIRIELDKIELNLLNIPLHIRYYINNTNKTKVFLSGGASLNVAMQANYFRKAEFASRGRVLDVVSTEELLDKTLINTQKIYSLGWVNGGTFAENRFLTADLGVGLERKISTRYSIFGQATYQHYLDQGIGPNKDRFNTLRFSAGARAKFR